MLYLKALPCIMSKNTVITLSVSKVTQGDWTLLTEHYPAKVTQDAINEERVSVAQKRVW